ncbi:exonuclease SbcCD subunit D C-terminal domain-containing protein [Undibacterium jejuense]|uniref:Nuclease SbcCD subunit D n=1 Tax=Undibacterium jejuense TaxID=1344949 RepID=A0A923KHM4_9BURK|nr:exonuclease SbcCD subunit D C-terminal domain-containing protein [Undibacterium jejuense]MBC3861162.1 exonuclease SbcCD subunit D C-terminal domain-containing protein [Undibacterium jejuense]
MRFIHTSDWHLGQTLHQFERNTEHQAFLDWLTATLVHQKADALLISGDIFDTANPSAAAQKQFYRFLQQAKAAQPHLQIVIIAGNHDSPGRMEAPAPLMESLDATVIGFVPRNPDGNIDLQRLIVPLRNAAGDIAAYCMAIPFLRPGDVPRIEDAKDPYMEGIALLYQQTLEYALRLRQPQQAIIALGHCHMTGGEISEESERRIVIGGTEALSANMFDNQVAYAALGHLHLAQKVGKQDHLRYCGSPIPLSFAEVDYQHQVLQVDLDGEHVSDITPLFVPRAVELLRVPRQPQVLAKVLVALTALDIPRDTPPDRMPFLEVRVLLDAPEPGLRATIEQALEGKPVRLAKIETSFVKKNAQVSDNNTMAELEKLQPDQIFERLYQSKYGTEEGTTTPPELSKAFAELMLGTSGEQA